MSVDDILDHAGANNWSMFDLAAAAYEFVDSHVGSQEVFLARYYGTSNPENSNPNKEVLRKLEHEISVMLLDSSGREVKLPSIISKLHEKLHELHIAPFGDKDGITLTLVWTLVKAVDQACANRRGLKRLSKRGPLNARYDGEVAVYLAPEPTSMRLHLAQGQLERISGKYLLNSQLSCIRCFRRNGGWPLPVLRWVARQRSLVRAMPNPKALIAPNENSWTSGIDHNDFREIRVDLELFSGYSSFIGQPNSESPLQTIPLEGSLFGVSYVDNYEALFAPLVCESIDKAIAHGCDILVFPELVIPQGLAETIAGHLRAPDRRNKLALVIAGSGWVATDDGLLGNNVCHIFDGAGNSISEYYKHSPFSLGELSGGMLEALAEPGAKSCVLDVEGLGRILPAICKDVVDDERYTLDLARDFEPDIVCIPALSASLNRGFYLPMRTLAERNLACSCMCNLCAARKEQEGEVEIVVALACLPGPSKTSNPKQPSLQHVGLTRTSNCVGACSDALAKGCPRSCLYVLQIVPDADGFDTIPERKGFE